jgi:hypothetical protein
LIELKINLPKKWMIEYLLNSSKDGWTNKKKACQIFFVHLQVFSNGC